VLVVMPCCAASGSVRPQEVVEARDEVARGVGALEGRRSGVRAGVVVVVSMAVRLLS
jgi:hypothetical protein